MNKEYAPFFEDLPKTQIPIASVVPDLGGISVAAYHEQGFTPPFRLLGEQDVSSLLQASKDHPIEETQTGSWRTTGVKILWGTQVFPDKHEISSFFGRQAFLQLAEELAGQPVQPTPECWSSLYRAGEYIDPHKDWRGAVHLMVCGRAPATPENGGSLVVEPDGEKNASEIFLTPGQAIAIDAKNLRHSTTPLTRTLGNTKPIRYAWIARYLEVA